MTLPYWIVSSQCKVLPDMRVEDFAPYEISAANMLRNEPFSFQFVFLGDGTVRPVSVSAVCEGLDIAAYRVDYVPLTAVANPYGEKGYVSDKIGLYPDLLAKRSANPRYYGTPTTWGESPYYEDEDNLLNATNASVQSVWFTVNPESKTLAAGTYKIHLTFRSLAPNQVIDEKDFTLTVLDACLPAQEATYTNWFYCDMLCLAYKVKPFTPEFYAIFRDYVTNAVRHRQNALLVPAFTPPLDTKIGTTRMNVQLVDVTKTADGWQFGFDRLEEFMRIADECGVRIFEHCHLFSQWGAVHAPAVYGTDGNMIFGWDTDASGEEYVTFIRAYLKAYFAFAEKHGWLARTFFHVSDEPTENNLPTYSKAVDTVKDLLAPFTVADALSDVRFYTEGIVKTPISSASHITNFDGVCPEPWIYYTCGPYSRNTTNRLISNTAARTRVLGAQMYRYHCKGFLHWGYNFWSDRLTTGWFNPASVPCGYKQMPGASYLCYPTAEGCAPSVREEHMREAMDDLRAFAALEEKLGREKVLALFAEVFGCELTNTVIPEGNACFALRQKVNALLA